MSQKLPVKEFEWIEETSQVNRDFIRNCNEESDEGYYLEMDVQFPGKLHELHNEFPFLIERKKTKQKYKNVLLIYMIKMNMSFTSEI